MYQMTKMTLMILIGLEIMKKDCYISSTQGLQTNFLMQKQSAKHQHEILDLPARTKPFINESLRLYY